MEIDKENAAIMHNPNECQAGIGRENFTTFVTRQSRSSQLEKKSFAREIKIHFLFENQIYNRSKQYNFSIFYFILEYSWFTMLC